MSFYVEDTYHTYGNIRIIRLLDLFNCSDKVRRDIDFVNFYLSFVIYIVRSTVDEVNLRNSIQINIVSSYL